MSLLCYCFKRFPNKCPSLVSYDTQQWLYLSLHSSVWCFTQVKLLGGSCFVVQWCSSYRSVLRWSIQWAWKCIDGLWTRRWNYSGKASTKILSLIFPTICQHVHLIIYLFVFLLPPSNPLCPVFPFNHTLSAFCLLVRPSPLPAFTSRLPL